MKKLKSTGSLADSQHTRASLKEEECKIKVNHLRSSSKSVNIAPEMIIKEESNEMDDSID